MKALISKFIVTRVAYLMFNSIRKFFRALDHRIKITLIFIGFHTWHQRLSLQYNQLYATELGATPVALGSINSISSIAGSLITIPSGWFADRYGLKRVLLLGLGLVVLVSGFYSFAKLRMKLPAWRVVFIRRISSAIVADEKNRNARLMRRFVQRLQVSENLTCFVHRRGFVKHVDLRINNQQRCFVAHVNLRVQVVWPGAAILSTPFTQVLSAFLPSLASVQAAARTRTGQKARCSPLAAGRL